MQTKILHLSPLYRLPFPLSHSILVLRTHGPSFISFNLTRLPAPVSLGSPSPRGSTALPRMPAPPPGSPAQGALGAAAPLFRALRLLRHSFFVALSVAATLLTEGDPFFKVYRDPVYTSWEHLAAQSLTPSRATELQNSILVFVLFCLVIY